MKRLLLPLVVFALLAMLSGCSEGACEKAEAKGKPTHACFVENREEERDLEESERDLKEAEYGSLEGAEEAEHQEEIEDEVEEVEEVLKQREAERAASALESVGK
jgi:hypothetical protein